VIHKKEAIFEEAKGLLIIRNEIHVCSHLANSRESKTAATQFFERMMPFL
jgi:hypothetical protein